MEHSRKYNLVCESVLRCNAWHPENIGNGITVDDAKDPTVDSSYSKINLFKFWVLANYIKAKVSNSITNFSMQYKPKT